MDLHRFAPRPLALLALATLTISFLAPAAAASPGSEPPASFVAPAARQWRTMSVAADGTQSNGTSGDAVASADGTTVAFGSYASNLVAGDTNGSQDVFATSTVTGAVERISVASDGTQANNASWRPRVSDDGRFVVFVSAASNLVAGDVNGSNDIFLRDRTAGTTTLVSASGSGQPGNSTSSLADISGDGRIIVFSSAAYNLVADDSNGSTMDIFVRDRVAGTVALVSRDPNGGYARSSSDQPRVSADGRYVVYESTADNLTGNPSGDFTLKVVQLDRQTGVTTPISRPDGWHAGNPDISPNGRYVTYMSTGPQGGVAHTTNDQAVFRWDRVTDTVAAASVSQANTPVCCNNDDTWPVVNDAGQVAWNTAINHDPSIDTAGWTQDVYVKDFTDGSLRVVSQNTSGLVSPGGASFFPEWGQDGEYLVFHSWNATLVAGDTNGQTDIVSVALDPVARTDQSATTVNVGVPTTVTVTAANIRAGARVLATNATVGDVSVGATTVTFVLTATDAGPVDVQLVNRMGDRTSAELTAVIPPIDAGAASFVPLTPTRLLDTRNGTGDAGGHLPAGGQLTVQIAGTGAVPADAVAIAANVTATGTDGAGYVTAWPAGSPRPAASTTNAPAANATVATAAILPLGPNGALSLFSQSGADLVVDVTGYWRSSSVKVGPGRLATLPAPVRVVDTRDGTGGRLGAVAPGASIDVDISAGTGIGADVSAVVVNLTATETTGEGYFAAWPAGSPRPNVSVLNVAAAGATRANLAIVPVGAGGRISVYSQGGAHVVVDVIGSFTGSSAALSSSGMFVPVAPTRIIDTRTPRGFARLGAAATGAARAATLVSPPSAGVLATATNVTMVEPASAGYLTVYASGEGRPGTSNINAGAGEIVPNLVVSRVDATTAATYYASAPTDVVVDLTGWFLAG